MLRKYKINSLIESQDDATSYVEKRRPVYPVNYNKADYKDGNDAPLFDGETPLEQIDLCSESESEHSDEEDSHGHDGDSEEDSVTVNGTVFTVGTVSI